MKTYDIEVISATIEKPSDWEWGNENNAYATFAIEASDEDEAEAIAEERLERGAIRNWEYADGTPVPDGVLMLSPDITSVKEAS